MNLGELRTNCVSEIERGRYTDLKGVKVLDFKLLAWYRIRDSRPWYVDNALCWCRAGTDAGLRWVLVHMARNPDFPGSHGHYACSAWHSYSICDAPNSWFLYFDHPPTNEDIYGQMLWFWSQFKFKLEWEMYECCIAREDWEAAIGEKPVDEFSKTKSLERMRAGHLGSNSDALGR